LYIQQASFLAFYFHLPINARSRLDDGVLSGCPAWIAAALKNLEAAQTPWFNSLSFYLSLSYISSLYMFPVLLKNNISKHCNCWLRKATLCPRLSIDYWSNRNSISIAPPQTW